MEFEIDLVRGRGKREPILRWHTMLLDRLKAPVPLHYSMVCTASERMMKCFYFTSTSEISHRVPHVSAGGFIVDQCGVSCTRQFCDALSAATVAAFQILSTHVVSKAVMIAQGHKGPNEASTCQEMDKTVEIVLQSWPVRSQIYS